MVPLGQTAVVLFCVLQVVHSFIFEIPHALPGLVDLPSLQNFITSLNQPAVVDLPQLISSSLPASIDDVAVPLKIVDSTFKEAILPEGAYLFPLSHIPFIQS